MADSNHRFDRRHRVHGPHVLPAPDEQVCAELFKLLESDDASISQICQVIRRDETISFAVSTAANSPVTGVERKIRSLEHAVMFLGTRRTTKLLERLLREYETRDESLTRRQQEQT